MKAADTMTRKVSIIHPDQPISAAAQMMHTCDAGSLPVGEDDRLIGVITDRDITIRAVARGMPPDTPVRQVMSKDVLYCFEDETLEDIAQNMGEQQIRRLPVLSRAKRLVGILSLGDLARKGAPKTTGDTVAAISRPGGSHDQAAH